MTTTALASQYAENLKNLNEDAEGVSQWERFFLQPLQQSYQTAQGQIEQQAGYDISQAYANYKQSQLNLLQNQQLTSGFKEQVASSLQSNYESTYNQARATELSNLVALQEEYNTDLAEENERLLGIGENLARLEEDIWGYTGAEDVLASGYYTMEDGNMVLTDLGRDVIQRVLYGTDNWTTTAKNGETTTQTGWAETLREADPDLYDWYSQNRGLVNTIIGGLDANTMDWTAEDETRYQERLTDREFQKRLDVVPNLQKGTAEVGAQGLLDGKRNVVWNNRTYRGGSFIIGHNLSPLTQAERKDLANKYKTGDVSVGDVVRYNNTNYAIVQGGDERSLVLQPLDDKHLLK